MNNTIPQIKEQLSNLVNATMFPHGIRLHTAQLCPTVKVIDIAKNTVLNMAVLVVSIQSEGTNTSDDSAANNNNNSSSAEGVSAPPARQVFLGLPSLSAGNGTLFGDVIMGMALFTHPSCPGCCLFNSETDLYEVAIKRSAVKNILAKVTYGGEANQENPLNEIALMEHMQRVASLPSTTGETLRFPDIFPHNMALELAATDGTTLFTILPRMKHCMDLFAYCFEHSDIKQARLALSFHERMQEAKMIMRALFRGVAALHAQGIAHRDLSLENGLISVTCQNGNLHIDDVKVIDYGMAVMNAHLVVRRDRHSHNSNSHSRSSATATASAHYVSLDAEAVFDFDEDLEEEEEDEVNCPMTRDINNYNDDGDNVVGCCATPFYGKMLYAPPECFYATLSQGAYDPRSGDVWACGVMLFTLAFHQVLFSQAHHQRDTQERFKVLYKDPQHGMRRLLQELLTSTVCHSEPLLMDLLCAMLRLVPQERLTIEQVLQHPWFQQA